jgi:hypothetical protein
MSSKYGFDSQRERQQQQYMQQVQRIDPIVRDILEDFASTLNWSSRESVKFFAESWHWVVLGKLPATANLHLSEYLKVWYSVADQPSTPILLIARTQIVSVPFGSTELKSLNPPEKLLQVLERQTGIKTNAYNEVDGQ